MQGGQGVAPVDGEGRDGIGPGFGHSEVSGCVEVDRERYGARQGRDGRLGRRPEQTDPEDVDAVGPVLRGDDEAGAVGGEGDVARGVAPDS